LGYRGGRMSLVWTKEPPTEPGWYWTGVRHKGKLSQEIVEVALVQFGLGYWSHITDDWEMVQRPVGYFWAGPIPQPTEPTE